MLFNHKTFSMLALVFLSLPICSNIGASEETLRIIALYQSDHVETERVPQSLSIVAFTITGQLVYIYQSTMGGIEQSIIRVGIDQTSGFQVRVQNFKDQRIDFNVSKTTAGAALNMIGVDGTLKDYFDLPQGVFVSKDGTSYFANIRINDPRILINQPEFGGSIWTDHRLVSGLNTYDKTP